MKPSGEVIKGLEEKTRQIKKDMFEMCVRAGTGHVTSSFSYAEVLTALYFGGVLRYDPKNPSWKDRDRFVLSKGQGSPILYAVLAHAGFYPKDWMDGFCAKDGKFGVHLQQDVPGVEITSGSLGQGLGVAAGMALGAKMNRQDHLVFSVVGDGECYEGSIWEAVMFASHNNLNNLIIIVDRNWLCVTDFTENLCKLNPMDEKFKAFGCEVKTIDGHRFEDLFEAFEDLRSRKSDKPLVIIADTTKGKGISFMENVPLWHGLAPSGEQAEKARNEVCFINPEGILECEEVENGS